MPRFQLRILRRYPDGRSGVATDSDWIEADTAEQAIAQARSITDTVLAGTPGISMLSNAQGGVLWSIRKDMPRPDNLAGF
jgi:hypothetical protein